MLKASRHEAYLKIFLGILKIFLNIRSILLRFFVCVCVIDLSILQYWLLVIIATLQLIGFSWKDLNVFRHKVLSYISLNITISKNKKKGKVRFFFYHNTTRIISNYILLLFNNTIKISFHIIFIMLFSLYEPS